MKLIRRTINQIALSLIPVIILGTLFINFTIRWIAYQEADEYLSYEMERIDRNFTKTGELPQVYGMSEIQPGLMVTTPTFRDTLLQTSEEGELEQYRELLFPISDDRTGVHHTVVLRLATIGKQEIAYGSVYIILGLMVLVALAILIVVNIQTERTWNPFFKTLDKLQQYRVQESAPTFEKTEINEFNMLNDTLRRMLQKMSSDYKRTKEFNENIAHELQTHLAVIKTSSEELLNVLPPEGHEMNEAKRTYLAATKLSHIQKSLILLSKIANKEFEETTYINPKHIILSVLEDFSEIIQLRGIQVTTRLSDAKLNMDHGLAVVLFTNLIKNSVKYNLESGVIQISLQDNKLYVENTGKRYTGDPQNLLQRFIHSEDGNTGLGLAIAKQICETYGFDLDYSIRDDRHIISILFEI